MADPALVAAMDQLQAQAHELQTIVARRTAMKRAQERCAELRDEYLDLLLSGLVVRKPTRLARDRYRKAHRLFMEHRFQEVLDL